MNKTMPKKVRKTLGVMTLTGAVALGAFSLLKTTQTAQNLNKISTTDQDGNGDNSGQDNGQGAILGLSLENEQNALNKINTLPESETEAAKNAYTFDIKSTGREKQVVRLNMSEIAKIDSMTGTEKFDTTLIKVKITGDNGYTWNGTMKELEDAQAGKNGFGPCFILNGKDAKESFTLTAWVDESTTLEQLFGPDGTKKQSLQFKVGAKGVQHKGFFDGAENGQSLIDKFEEAMGK